MFGRTTDDKRINSLRRSISKTERLFVFTAGRVNVVTDFDKFTKVKMNIARVISYTQHP